GQRLAELADGQQDARLFMTVSHDTASDPLGEKHHGRGREGTAPVIGAGGLPGAGCDVEAPRYRREPTTRSTTPPARASPPRIGGIGMVFCFSAVALMGPTSS